MGKLNFLRLFQSKQDVLVEEQKVIEQIHNEFDTAPERLLQEALAIIEANSNQKVTLESSIEEKAARLERVGFTSNGLVKKKEEISKRNAEKDAVIIMTNSEAELIQHYNKNYPFLKFLPESELDRICDKYGLIYAPVSAYKMPVPEKNLSEIENAQPVHVMDKAKNKRFFRVTLKNQWPYDGFRGSKLSRILNKGFYVDEHLRLDFLGRNDIIRAAKQYGGYQGNYNSWVTGVNGESEIIEENKQGLFIAAPKKHFDLKGLKFDKKKGYFSFTKTVVKSDPIVFRYVRGGVQVLTKWGLEANDPALQIEILN